MLIRVKAPGSCGELLQGTVGGEPFLVTCPVDLYAEATVLPSRLPHVGIGRKTELALAEVLRQMEIQEYPYQIRLDSGLPVGKGMASSSADIAAVCQAAALSLGGSLSPDELASIAVSVEPTDAIFFDGVVAFHHISGVRREGLGKPPALRIAVFDTGGSVDTLRFNRRGDLRELYQQGEAQLADALALLRQGIKTGDARLIGQSTTISARANQRVLYKPCLEEMIDIAVEARGVGVNVAHSGTVIGILFAPTAKEEIDEAIRLVANRLPELQLIKTVRLISGGLVIEGDGNG